MRKRKWLCALLAMAILFAGCARPGQVHTEAETVPSEMPPPTELTEVTGETEKTETETTAPEETQQSFAQLQRGYYILTKYASDDGMTMEGEAAKNMMTYVRVNENRSGQLYQMGTFTRLEWSDRYVIIDGENAKYTLDGDQITVVRAGIDQLTFTYCGDTLPEYLQHPELKAGTYYVCMYTYADEIYIVDDPCPQNGYLELREDKTGTLSFFEEDLELKWNDNNLVHHSNDMPYGYYEVEKDGVAAQLLVIQFNIWYTLVLVAEGTPLPGDYSAIISEL